MEAKFEEMVLRNGAMLRSYVMRLGVSSAAADDIVQEVFIRYYRTSDYRPGEVELVPWLKGIARNLAFNHFRSAKRRSARHEAAAAEYLAQAVEENEPDDLISAKQAALSDCLAGLPEKNRKIISMKYDENSSAAEIMQRTGMNSEAAVRMALMRIRKALKDCISGKVAENV